MERKDFLKTLGLLTAVGFSGISLASTSNTWNESDFKDLQLIDQELVNNHLSSATKKWYYTKPNSSEYFMLLGLVSSATLYAQLTLPNEGEDIFDEERKKSFVKLANKINTLTENGVNFKGIIKPFNYIKLPRVGLSVDELVYTQISIPESCSDYNFGDDLFKEHYIADPHLYRTDDINGKLYMNYTHSNIFFEKLK